MWKCDKVFIRFHYYVCAHLDRCDQRADFNLLVRLAKDGTLTGFFWGVISTDLLGK